MSFEPMVRLSEFDIARLKGIVGLGAKKEKAEKAAKEERAAAVPQSVERMPAAPMAPTAPPAMGIDVSQSRDVFVKIETHPELENTIRASREDIGALDKVIAGLNSVQTKREEALTTFAQNLATLEQKLATIEQLLSAPLPIHPEQFVSLEIGGTPAAQAASQEWQPVETAPEGYTPPETWEEAAPKEER